MKRDINEPSLASVYHDGPFINGDFGLGKHSGADYRLDLGEAGFVTVPAGAVLPYIGQAIRIMRNDEVLHITSDSELDVGVVLETMNSSLPGWCRSKDHVLLAALASDGSICFYKRGRSSRAMSGTHFTISTHPHS